MIGSSRLGHQFLRMPLRREAELLRSIDTAVSDADLSNRPGWSAPCKVMSFVSALVVCSEGFAARRLGRKKEGLFVHRKSEDGASGKRGAVHV